MGEQGTSGFTHCAGNLHQSISVNLLKPMFGVQGVYVFYLQLLTDMLHLCVYLVFFVIVFTNYGLPLHLVRYLVHLVYFFTLNMRYQAFEAMLLQDVKVYT